MLDPSKLDLALRRGGDVNDLVDRYRAANERRKELQGKLDELRGQRNAANKKMSAMDKKSDEFAAARDELRSLSQQIKQGEQEQSSLDETSLELLLHIPNAPHESVPDGKGEADNPVVSTWGEKPTFDFEPKNHWDIGETLGILDFESAAKISGARFCVLRRDGSRLNRALINFMLDLHRKHGYEEVWPPVLLRRESMIGTGQLPKFEDDAFKTLNDNNELFLSPDSEVADIEHHATEIRGYHAPRRHERSTIRPSCEDDS